MEKKVGNYIFFKIFLATNLLAIFFNASGSNAEIILRMQDMNHKQIDQAMCQAPFILQVELRNIEDYSDIHLIQNLVGMENFKSSQSITSRNVSIDNGRKTTKFLYEFVLRADKKGKFTLGPLLIKDSKGQQIKSNRLIVPVADAIVVSKTIHKDKYFVTTEVDKKQVYVGEKIRLQVKFYDRLFVDDLHLQFPNFETLYIVKNQHNFNKSNVMIDDEEYNVTEWFFDMYATEPGPLILQNIQAAFFAQELESKFKFGGAFDFFRSLHKTEQYLVAPPIKIDVVPLPQNNHKTQAVAVGQFSRFTISVNQQTFPAGQGIVLSTQLFGDANFETMKPIHLMLPDGFSYYDSDMATITEERNYKRNEFIVQAHTPGEYHIEPQILIYFDPVAQVYKTIQSQALDVTVTQAIHEDKSVQGSNLLDLPAEQDEQRSYQLQDFVVVPYATQFVSQMMIPDVWYTTLLYLLLALLILLQVYQLFFKKYYQTHPALIRYRMFWHAQQVCKKALKNNDSAVLLTMFSHLFAHLIDLPASQVSKADMLAYLENKGFSEQQIASWNELYHQILQASFSQDHHDDKHNVFQQSLAWIKLLKEKV